MENKLTLNETDYILISKKLEYTFKKSNNELVQKINNKEVLTDIDLQLLLKKFESRFKKSEPEIIERITTYLKQPNKK